MAHEKGRHPQTAALKDSPFRDLMIDDVDSVSGNLLVDIPTEPDIELECPQERLHHVPRSCRAPDLEWPRASAGPAGHEQVRHLDDVIRMQVGQEETMDRGHRHPKLRQSQGGTASTIEQQPIIAGLNQGTDAELIEPGLRSARRAEQDDPQCVGRRLLVPDRAGCARALSPGSGCGCQGRQPGAQGEDPQFRGVRTPHATSTADRSASAARGLSTGLADSQSCILLAAVSASRLASIPQLTSRRHRSGGSLPRQQGCAVSDGLQPDA